MSNTYQAVISDLSSQLQPETPFSLVKTTLYFMLFNVAVLSGFIYNFHLRPDIHAYLQQVYTVGAFLLFAGSVFCFNVGAFVSGIPGRKKIGIRLSAAGMGFCILICLGYAIQASGSTLSLDYGIACSRLVLMIATLPLFVLVVVLKRLAPTIPRLTGVLVFSGTGIIGTLGLAFLCPSPSGLHILVWHFGPVLGLSVLGVIFGKRLFRW